MRRPGRDRLVCALCVGVVLVFVAVCNVGGLVRSQPRASASLTERPQVAGATAQTADCERSVRGMLGLVPDAWGYGLTSGVSDGPLRQRYGAHSREVDTFDAVQGQMLIFFRLHGYVDIPDVLGWAGRSADEGCAGQ